MLSYKVAHLKSKNLPTYVTSINLIEVIISVALGIVFADLLVPDSGMNEEKGGMIQRV